MKYDVKMPVLFVGHGSPMNAMKITSIPKHGKD
jgi:aromatic ring-opening dioxygenase catalytic subunit (LigB family)